MAVLVKKVSIFSDIYIHEIDHKLNQITKNDPKTKKHEKFPQDVANSLSSIKKSPWNIILTKVD